MDCSGRLTGITRDIASGRLLVTLELDDVTVQDLQETKSIDRLSVTMIKYRHKRSLDANAYLWVLLQKIAEAIHSDKWSVYLDMLASYGVYTHVIVKPSAVERVKAEWRTIRDLGEVTVNGQTGIQLQCYFGSSTYDTVEMGRLIDGVVREAQDLGIETIPPDELRRMKQEWGV